MKISSERVSSGSRIVSSHPTIYHKFAFEGVVTLLSYLGKMRGATVPLLILFTIVSTVFCTLIPQRHYDQRNDDQADMNGEVLKGQVTRWGGGEVRVL